MVSDLVFSVRVFVVALYFSNVIVFFGQRNAISMLNHGCERGMHSFALLFEIYGCTRLSTYEVSTSNIVAT